MDNRRHRLAGGALLIGLAVVGARAEETEPVVARTCPHAAEAQEAIAERAQSQRPEITRVSRPRWQAELVEMVDRDQAARNDLVAAGRRSDYRAVAAVDRANLKRLRRMLAHDHFPTAAMVGYDGLAALWLLIQHADRDPAFQRRWLSAIETRAEAGELSGEQLAMFTDRVLLARGLKQRYGTQAGDSDTGIQLRPVEDPVHLDERRAAMGMIPESDYLCMLRAAYRIQRASAERRSE